MQEAASNLSSQIDYLYKMKAKIARGLAIVAREIAETGDNPEHTLEDIIKLAHILDIAAPPLRNNPNHITDPKYYLLDYIKRYVGSYALNKINGDDILFDKKRPFTCIGQVQEIFLDVYDKVTKNFLTEEAAYAS